MSESAEIMRKQLVDRQRNALLSGELVENKLRLPDEDKNSTVGEINDRYDRGEIRIVTEQARYPLPSLNTMLDSDDYKLDPDYQRRHRWTVSQKSRLIESFIMNVPVPPVFIYEYEYSKYEVMDGLQRLTAVREFYSNSFALENLEYWSELDGYKYSELPDRIKDGINRRYLSSIVLLKETSHGEEDPERLKRFVFGRINTGGVKLSFQELRNALYDGPMNIKTKRLSTSLALRRLWGIPENVEDMIAYGSDQSSIIEESEDIESGSHGVLIPKIWRDMTDVELVLRFFANRQRMIVYRDNIRDYLDAYLKAANKFDSKTIESLGNIFDDTVELAEAVFGVNAFRRPRANGMWASVPSVSIYDAVMNVLSRMLDEKDRLIARREDINFDIREFYNEHTKVFNLRGQTRTDVMTREIELERFIRSYLPAG